MAVSGTSVEFRIPQEPIPVPAMDEIGPVPLMSHDSQSFVVIKSAADLDDLSDDNEIADISILQEHKQIIQDELAQMDRRSPKSQPSPKRNSLEDSRELTTTVGQIQNGTGPPANSTMVSIQNGSGPLAKDEKVSVENSSNSRSTESNVVGHENSTDMTQSTFPALPQPQVCRPVDADDETRAISIISFAPSDFGSEEIQAKVAQLIDENTHLKDTIIQNNLTMKTHFDTIVAWQKDVERVHEAHKEKFRDAKKCIETLREENAILKQENENLRCSLQFQRTEHDKTKKLLTEASESNLKDFELDVANNKIKDLEQALQNLSLKNNESIATETAKLKAMEEKLSRYEKELENAYKQIREFEKGLSEQERGDLEKLKLTQEKLLLSEMTNERANKEIVSLRNQLARSIQATDDSAKVQFALNQAIAERDRLTSELESRNATIMDAQLRNKKLEEELQHANDIVKQRDDANKVLKEKEEQAQIEAWMAKQKLADMEQKYQFLQKSFEASQQSKPQFVPEFNSGELAYIRQQLMQSQKALTECQQNRAVAEAEVRKQKDEIAELRKQLETKQDDSDDVFALHAQLDVYKADFEAEREAKEDVKRDKNKIAEDLQHLHRRNQQLQEEIEILREQLQQQGSIPRRHPESSRNEAASNEAYIFKCPKCQFGFKTLNAVENHVARCLDDVLP